MLPTMQFAVICLLQFLFNLLKTDDDLVMPKLNEYFPRDGFQHDRAVSSRNCTVLTDIRWRKVCTGQRCHRTGLSDDVTTVRHQRFVYGTRATTLLVLCEFLASVVFRRMQSCPRS